MTDIESAPPKLFEHVCRVFEAMRRGATPEQLKEGDSTRHAFVYEGHTTKLFRELGLATPYYTSVLQRLQRMGCIRQLSRGGGSAPSRWELLKDPEFGEFDNAGDKKRGRRADGRLTLVEAVVEEFGDRLAAVEAELGLGEAASQ
jgi:hypothetical protein